MLICQECNGRFVQITNTHLKNHNLTLSEYEIKYPNALLCVDKSEHFDEYRVSHGSWNKAVTKTEYPQLAKTADCKRKISEKLSGKAFSEEHKKALRLNHRTKRDKEIIEKKEKREREKTERQRIRLIRKMMKILRKMGQQRFYEYKNEIISIPCLCKCGGVIEGQRKDIKHRKYLHGHRAKGMPRSELTKQKVSESLKADYKKNGTRLSWNIGLTAEEDPRIPCKERTSNWRGGISFELYPIEFSSFLKKRVRRRDGYRCRECEVSETELGYKLHVHHIDYDKQNIALNNLISLCRPCHMKTSFERNDWTNYFKQIVEVPPENGLSGILDTLIGINE